jgi:membrane protease YdiL (CAAX protease family)
VLETWTSLLGAELGARAARAKGLSALLTFVAVVLVAMSVVLGADGGFLSTALVIVAVLLLVSALAFLLLSLRQVSGEVVRRLAASGLEVRRPPLLLRAGFVRWLAASGLDVSQLRARTEGAAGNGTGSGSGSGNGSGNGSAPASDD